VKRERDVITLEEQLTPAQRDLLASHWDAVSKRADIFSKRSGVPADDLLGPAHDAMVIAARRYDPSLGAFARFAMTYVDGAMRDEIWRQRRRGVPYIAGFVARREQLAALGNAREYATMTHSVARAAKVTGMAYQIAALVGVVALQPQTTGGEEAAHAAMLAERRRQLLAAAEERMTPDERRMYQLLYVEGRTHAEAAAELGVATKSIQRLNNRVLARLEATLKSAGLAA